MHKPPSRLRYEADHPTISLRVTLEDKKRLQEMAERMGVSLAEAFRVNMGLTEKRIDSVYDAGYEKGLQDGVGRFEVPCCVCGRPMRFDTRKEEKVRRVVLDAFKSWRHTACSQKI